MRNLLRTFGVPHAIGAAEGWGGGRVGLYVSPTMQTTTAAFVLRWDTVDDAAEWRAAVARYVGAAFPGAAERDCPPLDGCWSSASDIASGVLGSTSVFASGPASDTIATALLVQK